VAAPTVATRSGNVQATATTSHAITLPASVGSTDLVICIFSADTNPTCSTSSTGWHKLGQASNSTVVTGAVFFTWGNNALTVTTSASVTSSHVTLRVPGGGVPWGQSANGNSTNSNPPAETAGYLSDYLFVASRSGDANVQATVAPTGYSNLTTQTGAAGGTSTATAEKGATSVGTVAEDPGTFTSATEQWVCWTLSVPNAFNLSNQTVIDNFNDGTLNTAVDGVGWENWGGAPVTETGGQLVINQPAAATYHGINQWAYRTLNEQFLGSKLVSAGNQALTSLEVYPALVELNNADEDTFYIYVSLNTVYCVTALGPTPTYTTRGTYPYNSVIHLYGAVGEWQGNIVWILSPDGIHWRILGSFTDPTAGAFTVQGEIMVGQWNATGAGATSPTWDDFSIWSDALSATATPGAIAAPVGIPSTTQSTGSSLTAPVVAAPASIPASTRNLGATPTPAAIAASVSVPVVSVATTQSANVTPLPFSAPVTIPAQTRSAGSSVAASAIPVSASIPAQTRSAGSTATPSAVPVSASIPASVARGNVNVSASPIVAPASVPSCARSW
jgi:hypothetical protein